MSEVRDQFATPARYAYPTNPTRPEEEHSGSATHPPVRESRASNDTVDGWPTSHDTADRTDAPTRETLDAIAAALEGVMHEAECTADAELLALRADQWRAEPSRPVVSSGVCVVPDEGRES